VDKKRKKLDKKDKKEKTGQKGKNWTKKEKISRPCCCGAKAN